MNFYTSELLVKEKQDNFRQYSEEQRLKRLATSVEEQPSKRVIRFNIHFYRIRLCLQVFLQQPEKLKTQFSREAW